MQPFTTGTTRTFTLPNTSSELAILAGTQTFTGNKTFSGTLTASGTVTVSAASASIGTATTTATYGMGTGATTTGVTKTVNLGTGGASGSTTVVNIGSATAGSAGTTAALATTLTLAAVTNCIGIGFQRGTHTRWQLVTNDGTGAPSLTDMGATFGIATGGVLTLFIAAPPNGSSVWVRVVDEVSGAVFEQEITANLPASRQFLAPRLFMNNGATAAAVVYDCSGVYVETDY